MDQQIQYELPDGSIISIPSDPLSKATDVLFHHSSIHEKSDETLGTIPEMVVQAISMCNKDLQRDLSSAVVLAGGTTMIPGTAHIYLLKLIENQVFPNAYITN